MCGGWIKVHRKMVDSSIFSSGDSFLVQLWVYILLKVNHEPRKIIVNSAEVTIEAGQGIFGLNQIVKDLTGLKKEASANFRKMKTTYYRRLKTLENIQNVKLTPTNKYTVITVVNWGCYQEDETQVKLKRNSSETLVKTNKNDKNDKNERIRVDVLPYLDQYGNKMIEKFVRYWIETDSKGVAKWRKQKTWDIKLRLITWHEKENEYRQVKTQKSNAAGGAVI